MPLPCDRWKGKTVYVVADNEALRSMPNPFWRMLYGEPVVGVGHICSVADDPVHKGDFMPYREKTLSGAVQKALGADPRRVVVIGAGGRDTDKVYHLRSAEDLEAIAFEDYVKEIPKLVGDEGAIVVGGGPSCPWEEIKAGLFNETKMKVLGVNRAVLLGNGPLDVLFFGDARAYWGHYGKEKAMSYIDAFDKPKFTCNHKWPCDTSMVGVPGIVLVRCHKGKGLMKRPDRISFNHSSGGAAIDLAAHMGAKKIVLVGYDMKAVDGDKTWYERMLPGDKGGLGWSKTKPVMYDHFLNPMNMLALHAERRGIEILNATPDSALDCFPKVKLENAI